MVVLAFYVSAATLRRTHRTEEYLGAGIDAQPLPPTTSISSLLDSNAGDLASRPNCYIPFLRNSRSFDAYSWHPQFNRNRAALVNFVRRVSVQPLIIGGGGLLQNDFFAAALDYYAFASRAPRILWGVGTNSSDLGSWRARQNAYKYSQSNFDLIGVRDYATRFDWVPCASCLSPLFDVEVEPTRAVGFFLHAVLTEQAETIRQRYPDAEICVNFAPFDTCVNFIRNSEVVVTNSYHGAYWAMLCGRKVVAIPTSSKFFHFKHPVTLGSWDSWHRDMNRAREYRGVLEEYRSRNVTFARRVYQRLGEYFDLNHKLIAAADR
jgi:hypothetical protein